MKKQIYKLTLYTLAAGLISRIILYFVLLSAVSLTTQWTANKSHLGKAGLWENLKSFRTSEKNWNAS